MNERFNLMCEKCNPKHLHYTEITDGTLFFPKGSNKKRHPHIEIYCGNGLTKYISINNCPYCGKKLLKKI